MSETTEIKSPFPEGTSAGKALAMLVLPQGVLVALAFFAERVTGVDPLDRFSFEQQAALVGIVAAITIILLVYANRFLMPKLWAELDRQAHAIFGAAPFKLTWPIVLLLSAVAGIAEEIVFRGALQGWLETLMPLWLAIILQAVIFAALHPISRAYMTYVLLIGIVLGALYAWSGNLLAPMIAHFAYDVWALRRLYRQPMPASGEVEADA